MERKEYKDHTVYCISHNAFGTVNCSGDLLTESSMAVYSYAVTVGSSRFFVPGKRLILVDPDTPQNRLAIQLRYSGH